MCSHGTVKVLQASPTLDYDVFSWMFQEIECLLFELYKDISEFMTLQYRVVIHEVLWASFGYVL